MSIAPSMPMTSLSTRAPTSSSGTSFASPFCLSCHAFCLSCLVGRRKRHGKKGKRQERAVCYGSAGRRFACPCLQGPEGAKRSGSEPASSPFPDHRERLDGAKRSGPRTGDERAAALRAEIFDLFSDLTRERSRPSRASRLCLLPTLLQRIPHG